MLPLLQRIQSASREVWSVGGPAPQSRQPRKTPILGFFTESNLKPAAQANRGLSLHSQTLGLRAPSSKAKSFQFPASLEASRGLVSKYTASAKEVDRFSVTKISLFIYIYIYMFSFICLFVYIFLSLFVYSFLSFKPQPRP